MCICAKELNYLLHLYCECVYTYIVSVYICVCAKVLNYLLHVVSRNLLNVVHFLSRSTTS